MKPTEDFFKQKAIDKKAMEIIEKVNAIIPSCTIEQKKNIYQLIVDEIFKSTPIGITIGDDYIALSSNLSRLPIVNFYVELSKALK